MRTDCIPAKFTCPTSRGAKPGRIEADFSGDAIPSHEGLLLAGPAEGRLGLFARVAACFKDVRRPDSSAPPSDVIRPPSTACGHNSAPSEACRAEGVVTEQWHFLNG